MLHKHCKLNILGVGLYVRHGDRNFVIIFPVFTYKCNEKVCNYVRYKKEFNCSDNIDLLCQLLFLLPYLSTRVIEVGIKGQDK